MKTFKYHIAESFLLRSDNYWRQTFIAIILGVVIACVGLAVFPIFEYLIPPEYAGRNAGEELFKRSNAEIFFYAGFVIPFLETFLAQTIPIETLRRLHLPGWLLVFISASLFSFEHYRNGGLLHAAGVTFAGGFLSIIYVGYRSTSIRRAYYVTAIAHCANNVFLFILSVLE